MSQDGANFKTLYDALLDAFPTKGSLERVVMFGCGERLDNIAPNADIKTIVFDLVQWADTSEGRIEDLLREALNQNPGNAKLNACAERFGVQTQNVTGNAPVPHLVPDDDPNIIGRDEFIAEILVDVDTERLINLVGLGGIGKSEIARKVFHAAKGKPWAEDGVFYFDLAALDTADAVKDRLARELGAKSLTDNDAFAAQLSAKRLYILDDLYPALLNRREAVVTLLQALRDYASPARFLLTNREIALPGVELTRYPGVLAAPYDAQLVRNRANRNGYRWNDGDDARLAHLLPDLNGVPLALRIVADLLQFNTLEEVVELWRERRTKALQLPGFKDAPPNKLNSVDYSLVLSYNALRDEPDGRALFGLFADLPGGASIETLEAVLGDAGLETAIKLRSRSLLERRTGRFIMLVPVREFAAANRDHEAVQPLCECLDDYLLKLANEWGDNNDQWLKTPGIVIRSLATELPNLHAALDRNDARYCADLTSSISYFYSFSMPGAEAIQRLQSGANAAHAIGDHWREARCLLNLGDANAIVDEYDEALTGFNKALALYRKVNSRSGEADCLQRLGDLHSVVGKYDDARAFLNEALALFREDKAHLGEASCLLSLGEVSVSVGKCNEARVRFNEALALYRKVGSRHGEATCLLRLGEAGVAVNKYDDARANFNEALTLFHENDYHLGEATCFWGLGRVCVGLKEFDNARSYYHAALPLYKEIGVSYNVAELYRYFGELYAAEGNLKEAIRWMEQSAELYTKIENFYWADQARKKIVEYREAASTSQT